MRDQAGRDDATMQIGAVLLTFGLVVASGTLLVALVHLVLPAGVDEPDGAYFPLLVVAGAAVAVRRHLRARRRAAQEP